MTIYVDELQRWPTRIRCFQAGAAHLTADEVDELHDFARLLGLKRQWFQNRPGCPHYDLTKQKREAALRLGAISKSGRDQARARRIPRF